MEGADVTGLNEDPAFPVENLLHRFLEVPFQSSGLQAEVDIDFSADTAVSAIGLAWHNLSSAEADLVNASGTVLRTIPLEIEFDTNITYFEETQCRRIEVRLTSPDILRLGGMSVGVPVSFQEHARNPIVRRTPRGQLDKTTGGQGLGRRARRLRSFEAAFPILTDEQKREYEDMVDVLGYTTNVFIDLFDGDHQKEQPVRGNIAETGEFQLNSNRDRFGVTIAVEESR